MEYPAKRHRLAHIRLARNDIGNDGFVYKNGTFTDFGVGPDSFDWGWAIDDAGNIAGFDVQQDENVAVS